MLEQVSVLLTTVFPYINLLFGYFIELETEEHQVPFFPKKKVNFSKISIEIRFNLEHDATFVVNIQHGYEKVLYSFHILCSNF
jgi:hypothetical protein